MTTATDELNIMSIELPKSAIAKAGCGIVFLDGAYHVLEALGFFTTIPGAETMPMGEFVAASQAIPINWMLLGWGALLIITAILLYKHIK